MKKVVSYFKAIFTLIFRAIFLLIRKVDKSILKIVEKNPNFTKLSIIPLVVYFCIWGVYMLCICMIIFSCENLATPNWMHTWEYLNFHNFLNPSFLGTIEIMLCLYIIRVLSYLSNKLF